MAFLRLCLLLAVVLPLITAACVRACGNEDNCPNGLFDFQCLPVSTVLGLERPLTCSAGSGPEILMNDAKNKIPITAGQNKENTLRSPSETSDAIYEVKPALEKGLGVFATRNIKRGTPIMIELPLFSIEPPDLVPGQGFPLAAMITSIAESFASLTSAEKSDYLALHAHRFPSEEHQNKLLLIFRSNAYNTGDDRIGIFPKIARINHSCKPNSGNWWSERQGKRLIYAARDIRRGEEITVSYIPLLKTREEREVRLGQYGFICDCVACRSKESDTRRVEIASLLGLLEQELDSGGRVASVNKRLVAQAIRLIDLAEVEGLTDYLARCYHLAAEFERRQEHWMEARKWAMKELQIHQYAEEESAEALATMEFLDSLR